MNAEEKIIDGLEQFADELEAGAELKLITPSNAELQRLADRFPAPQEWYEE